MSRRRRRSVLRSLLTLIRDTDPQVQILVARGVHRDGAYRQVFGESRYMHRRTEASGPDEQEVGA